MRPIDADALIKELNYIYEHAKWDPRELHFSLLDMQMNIDGMPTLYFEKKGEEEHGRNNC